MTTERSTGRRSRIAVAGLGLALALAAAAAVGGSSAQQELRVVVDRTDLRWSSTGRLLGRLTEGARIERLGGRGGWTRARIRGWMPAASLEPAGEGLRIGPAEEALRETPGGEAFGALVRGVEVTRLDAEGEWREITMIGWLPDSTVAAVGVPARPAAEEPSPAPAPSATAIGRLDRGVVLRGAPEGPRLVALPAGLVVRATESRGGWTRITVEGWVPAEAIETEAGDEGLDPAVVLAAPASTYDGRRISWTLEHVSVQRADAWRSDFRPGETYALTRIPGSPSPGYVYLVLPEELVEPFRELAPFTPVRVEGRIRTGRSALTGSPIVDVERFGR